MTVYNGCFGVEGFGGSVEIIVVVELVVPPWAVIDDDDEVPVTLPLPFLSEELQVCVQMHLYSCKQESCQSSSTHKVAPPLLHELFER